MPQKQQNIISQTAPNIYNQFLSLIIEALIWLKISTDTGNKLKVETQVKERHQKLMELIRIETIKFEPQKYSEQEIITFPMNPIINSSFNKHPM